MIVIVHVLVAIGITGLVLLQQGKGADMGASFGSGASQTIFGSTGSGNVLTKSTSWLAVIFFITSLALALFARQQASQGVETSSLIKNQDQLQTLAPAQDVPQVPALDASSDVPQATVATEVDAAVDAAVEAVATEAADAAVETVVEETADAAASEVPEEQAVEQAEEE